MKKLLFLQMMLLAVTCSLSCSSDGDDGDGGGSDGTGISNVRYDADIVLSSDFVEFSPVADTSVVTVSTDEWWLESVSLTDGSGGEPVLHALSDGEKEATLHDKAFGMKWGWLSMEYSDRRITLSVEAYSLDESSVSRSFVITLKNDSNTVSIRGEQYAGDGFWRDCIGLAPTSITFPAAGGTEMVVATKAPWWMINSVRIDDANVLDAGEYFIENEPFERSFGWVTLRNTETELYVTAAPNTTGKRRQLKMSFMQGDYNAWLEAVQEAE